MDDLSGEQQARGAGEGEPSGATASRLLAEVRQLGAALAHLFGAQWHLFRAELSLARGGFSLLFAAGLAATVIGVGFGLTVIALIGVALAKWFGSWLWALAMLALVQAVLLGWAIVLFRRGLHWLSLPATRGEFGAMMRDVADKARHADGAQPDGATDPTRNAPP
ncbi:MAG TPA: ABC transporter ATP-binding protein [Dyella sp.]|nr:ABC transporter ATP-binding protein [Dyella sp.]